MGIFGLNDLVLRKKPNRQSLSPYLDLHNKANERVTPATFKRGIINAVNVQSKTADVQVVGNQNNILKNVPVSSAIDITTLQPGNRCRIDMFDEANQNDMVVAYTY